MSSARSHRNEPAHASKKRKLRPPNTCNHAARDGGAKTGPPWVRLSPAVSVGSFGGPAAVIWLSGVPWCAVIPKEVG